MRKSINKTRTSATKASKKKIEKLASIPKVASPSKAVDFRLLEEVHDFMKEQDLVELRWESKGVNLHLRKRESPLLPLSASNGLAAMPVQTLSAPAVVEKAPPVVKPAPVVQTKTISSPFVGTFYRAPSPNEKNFVDVGQIVKSGDPLCIVEAMKLMNEIESDLKGRIVKILVDDATPVEYGEPLFEIEPL